MAILSWLRYMPGGDGAVELWLNVLGKIRC